jgi:hypothetical protein
MADDCIICGNWPERDRWALREMLDTLPVDDEPICDECLMAFWQNCIEPLAHHWHTPRKNSLAIGLIT